MYEPFQQAIDQYPEQYQRGPDHLSTPDDFAAFLAVCDTCSHRNELWCPKCKCRMPGKSCIRLAELPEAKCPKGKT